MFNSVFRKKDAYSFGCRISILAEREIDGRMIRFVDWYKIDPNDFSKSLNFIAFNWDIFFCDHKRVAKNLLPGAMVKFLQEANVGRDDRDWISFQEFNNAAIVYDLCNKHKNGGFKDNDDSEDKDEKEENPLDREDIL
ncbi:MAG: hypothetical protein WCX77_04260 [Candidatus Paceibacterota bacterium]|jgi:hypothetical protein